MNAFSKRKISTPNNGSNRFGTKLNELLLDQAEQSDEGLGGQVVLELDPIHFYSEGNIRKQIDEHEIKERAASMHENGQIQPITVYPKDDSGRYRIDKGQCRWLAAQLIPGFKLKAIIDHEASKRNRGEQIIGQFVENDSRSDMATLDQVDALVELKQSGMKLDAIAKAVGWLKKGTLEPNINKVSRVLSVTKLPEEGRGLIEDGIVTDYITLELLRKINDIDPDKFRIMCDLARKDEGITRKRVDLELKLTKGNSDRILSAIKPETKKTGATKQKLTSVKDIPQQENKASLLTGVPQIRVEWKEIKEGILRLDIDTGSSQIVVVKLDDGIEINAELNEVQIIGIERNLGK